MQPLDNPAINTDTAAKLDRRAKYLLRFLEANRIMPPKDVAVPIAAAYARIVSFFAGDCGITKPKGVLLFGTTGCGKTTLVRAIKDCCRYHLRKQNFPHGFIFLRARRLCEDYAADENFVPTLREMCKAKTVILDDLGTDRAVSRYGVSWGMEDFIEDRYDTWEECGHPTLITSNLQRPADVLERYGERAMSRLIGMVDFVAYKYHDRRVNGH